MKQIWHNNGLSIALVGLFLITQIGLSVVGYYHHNDEQTQHRRPQISYIEYVMSPAFFEATAENWESEFLQMCAYVVLTTFLYQKGSAESKKLDEPEPVDRDPRSATEKEGVPWPVKKGGVTLKLYECSLSLALFSLFAISFVWHAWSGSREYSDQELTHGGAAVTTLQYIATSQFWFESLQNWQSEFLSIGVMVLLSIFLRQRGSPESKPVDAPHWQTGGE